MTPINGVITPVITSRGPTCTSRRDKSRLQQKSPVFPSIEQNHSGFTPAQKYWRNVDKKKIHIIPSLKLTVLTWKWMVGRRSFPFGGPAFFWGALLAPPLQTKTWTFTKKNTETEFWPQKKRMGNKRLVLKKSRIHTDFLLNMVHLRCGWPTCCGF